MRTEWMRRVVSVAMAAAVVWAACGGTARAQDAASGGEAKPTMMAKDADPDWEVVTVKPSDPNDMSSGFHMDGRQIFMERRTVATMLLVGNGMHRRQVVNAPDWIDTDRWDIRGLPDVPGHPSLKQESGLVRKLLVERFGLVTHMEQREMPVYALTVAKGGPKMTPNTSDPNGLPDDEENESGGEISMRIKNGSTGNLALLLKVYMDRPVVDQTGLTGRYDLQLKWTQDETRAPTDASAPPGVFTAIQEQIGLKLEPVKATTDVLVIDKVERPGAN